MIRLILCWMLLLATPALANGSLEASVDRTRLVEGESVELTLESAAANRFGRPDLTPLEEHFQIQGSRQLSLIGQLNGQSQPVTRWIVTLLPKRTGYVVIPPIGLGDSQSAPISLQVLSASQAAQDSVSNMAPVFIDSEVDTETPYVQAQTLLTLRVYHSASLYDDSTLSGLDIPDARVESLGPPRHYERLINGVRHGVIEIRYAVFAQRSGELEIPSQLFSATILQARDPGERFSARSGRLVQVRSPSIMLDVQPVPAHYPADAPWLPARELTLTQQWQPDPGVDLLSGESLTRTLTLEAEGLSASQLPALQSLAPGASDQLRQYADQPKLENVTRESGIRALRQDSAALVAQADGSFTLPALQVHWWDTQADTLQTATLDPVTLNVIASDSFADGITAPVAAATAEPAQARLLWPWQLACALLTLALAAALLALHRIRQSLLAMQTPDDEEDLVDEIAGNPLGDLQSACRSNQPAEARKALDVWARQLDPDGLIGLTHRYPDLADALDNLNECLFGQSDVPWRGKPLWRAVRLVIQSRQRPVEESDQPLAGLYPDV